jgi:glycosyltransferase involved in cell wall biosynthesis
MPLSRDPIRILRIIARLNIGGPAIQAVTLTRKLSDGGFESLLVTGSVGSNEGDMGYLAEEAGVQPVFVPELGRALSSTRDLRAFIQIRNIISRYRPHILHTHTAKAGTLGRLAALTASRKAATVHTFHGHVFHGYFSRWKSTLFILIERMLALFTDRIVVISQSQHREICRIHRIAPENKVRTVPLGFELGPFQEAAKRPDLKIRKQLLPADVDDDDAFLIGCIGRLTAIKNHQMLIDAVHLLKKEDRLNHLHVAVVGGGEMEGSLRKSAAALGVEDRIHFCGWHADMPAVYAALDAVVLTSKNEGTPVTIIEAMAAGKPVVATDVGGVADLLGASTAGSSGGFFQAKRGLLVDSDTPRALTEALFYLCQNPAQIDEMKAKAQKWVFENYGIDRLVDDVKTLYLNVLSDKHML